MRVKVGSEWFEAKAGQPIAVELTPKDRENIAAMPPEASRYAIIPEPDAIGLTYEEKMAWLAEG